MVNSMTGFAAMTGQDGGSIWDWEIRSVNAKGLDIKSRLPEGTEKLEKIVKDQVSEHCARGSIFVNLRVKEAQAGTDLTVNEAVLSTVLDGLKAVQVAAAAKGVELAPSTPADVLAVRNVMESGQSEKNSWLEKAQAQLPALITDFKKARSDEGARIKDVLSAQIEMIDGLVGEAMSAADGRQEATAQKFRERVSALLSQSDGVDEQRLEQEIAILAVKADVAEELDRLVAHVAAARALLTQSEPIGRKFDFLMQEFNREANTLCSKSGDAELTRIGLSLKTTIDQTREQVQNIE